MSRLRRNFEPEFKAKVVLELLREEMTLNELAARNQINPVVTSWCKSG